MNTLAARAVTIKMAQLDKEAVNLRKGVAGAGILASLLNPMKSIADDAMLAEAKMLASQSRPTIAKQVDEAIGSLGFAKRVGANMYGTDKIVDDLATATGNLDILNKYRMPIKGGDKLKKEVELLRKNIIKNQDVDLDNASDIYGRLQKYIASSSKDIKDYVPPQYLTSISKKR